MTERPCLVILLIFLCLTGCGPGEHEQREEPGDAPLILERWPGEGVPVLAWHGPGDSLDVYERPGVTFPAGRIAVTADQELPWDRSVIRVEEPGRMEIEEDCIIGGFVYDPPKGGQLKGGRARDLYLPAGTSLEVVCYAAEGFYIFLYQGEFIEMEAGRPGQRMLAEPETRWWVRMTQNGKPLGWIWVDEDKIMVTDRRF